MATVPLELSKVSFADKPNTIWKYFGFVPDGNGKPINTNKPQCKICRAAVSMKTSNATNLHFHLQQKHLQWYAELMKTSECSSLSSSTSKASSKAVKDLPYK